MRPSRPLSCVLAAWAASLGAGCSSDPTLGYAAVSAHGPAAGSGAEVRTVATPMFENTTFSHGLEATLTEALAGEVARSTPWGLADSGVADTTLRGTVVAVRLRPLSTNRTSGLVSEMAVDIEVDFEWVDNRTGRPILSRRGFRASGAFAPGQGALEPIETGEQGAVERLARAIVAELRSDW